MSAERLAAVGGTTSQVRVRHGLGRSVVLHLAPGLVMLGFYLGAGPRVVQLGFPPLFASLLTIPLILVPWMLGYLILEARRATGGSHLAAVLSFRSRVPRWQYFAYGVPIILWSLVVFQASEATISPVLVDRLGGWLPDWFLNPADLDYLVGMSPLNLTVFLAALLVFSGVVAPVVEELYFRGHLMAGLSHLGAWAPTLHVALFTLYHFESPWENPARFLMVLPLAYLVWRTDCLRLAVAIHVALNVLSALALSVAVLTAR